MSDAILASALSAAAVVIVALITFYANTRQQIRAKWRDQKIAYYSDYFDALSQLAATVQTPELVLSLATKANRVHLIASPKVLEALHAYQKVCIGPHRDDSDEHNQLLSALINSVRNDLGVKSDHQLDRTHINLLSMNRQKLLS